MAQKVIETPSGPVVVYTPEEDVNTENVTRGSQLKTKDIGPSGYFTTDPSIGGGKANTFQYLLDPMDPAGAYRAFINSRLFPSDIDNYQNITSSGALTSGPFSLLPTSEGFMTAAAGYVNPLAGGLTRGAINARNAEALETLANQGILQTVKSAEPSSGFRNFLGYEFTPGTGEYRLAPDVELAIKSSGSTPQEYFESQYQSEFGEANELAKYLDQMAYATKGEFFQKDLFGNPTPVSKYVDRQGNIRPDALENWKKFGQKDKMGVLASFFDNDSSDTNQGTQDKSSNKRSSRRGGINTLLKGRVSEPRGSAPDFLSGSGSKSGGFDAKSGRRIVKGTTNLFQG